MHHEVIQLEKYESLINPKNKQNKRAEKKKAVINSDGASVQLIPNILSANSFIRSAPSSLVLGVVSVTNKAVQSVLLHELICGFVKCSPTWFGFVREATQNDFLLHRFFFLTLHLVFLYVDASGRHSSTKNN